MIKNFFLITFRKIVKNKGSSYLNVLGLTFGLATSLFIFHYIHFELNYDTKTSEEHVYRVESYFSTNEESNYIDARTFKGSAPYIGQNFDEIQSYTRLIPFSEEGTGLFRKWKNDSTEISVYIPKVFYAESTIFNVFNISLESGHKASCLNEPNSIILSRSTVQDVFKKELASGVSIVGKKFKSPGIGKVIKEYTITGIFADRPNDTHLKFDALVSKSMEDSLGLFQEKINTYSYVTIAKSSLSQKLKNGIDYPNNQKECKIQFRPISEIHMTSGISGNPEANANKRLLLFLSIISVVILLLASTNHTNNIVFNSIDRAKEIGVRKLLGIKPKQLFLSFLGEAFAINLIAILLAIAVFLVGVQVIKVNSGIAYPSIKEIDLTVYLPVIISLLFISTALSGLYPAYYLTSLSPIASLKSKYEFMSSKQFSSAGSVIRFLIIFQLGVSITFLCGLYIVYSQLEYLKEKDQSPMEVAISGIFPGASGAGNKFTEEVYFGLNEYQKTAALESYSISNLYKDEIKTVQWTQFDSIEKPIKLSVVDHTYIKKTKIKFISGRNFHVTFGNDAGNAIITSSVMNLAGYNHPDSVLGKNLVSKGSRWRVIGVVKNNSKDPEIYLTGFRYRTYVEANLNYPGLEGETLNQFLSKTEYYLSKALPFFSFYKRNYQKQGDAEEYVMKLFFFFSIMTLLIANIGMLGLSSFIAQKRKKEIGIRKVLGAESIQILIVLAIDFSKLIGLASIIAIPLVLLGTRKWLENYAYRITLEPIMILIPLTIVLLIAFAVVAEKCIHLAVTSPLESLKE